MPNPIVSRAEWLVARKALLAQEKQITRALDALHVQRRALPWVKVEREYVFEGPKGTESLADLFDGRSQLILQHFMFGPGWKEGCPGCSHTADHVDGPRQHFEHRDVSYVAVSRAPWRDIEPFRKRMGWGFHWVSSNGTDFNFDYGVSATPEMIAAGERGYNFGTLPFGTDELPGVSVFFKDDEGTVFHTYSAYARGVDILMGTHNYLDLTPKGRNETGEDGKDRLRHHDRYDSPELVPISRAPTTP